MNLSRRITRLLARPYKPGPPPPKDVAIVVPLSTRAHLLPDEEISLRHLNHYLGRYDKYVVAPRGLQLDFEGFGVKRFSRKFFGSVSAHNHLLHTKAFYRGFREYRFIFFYHLDSLVFSDQLREWCATDLDFIGPPWIHCSDSPWVTTPRVGNGGFSLLRVEAALKVLHNRHRLSPETFWLDPFTRSRWTRPIAALLKEMRRLRPESHFINVLLNEWECMENPSSLGRNSDAFWSDNAVHYDPAFRVATLEQGLRFGFEVAPRKCFEMNGARMPFGCHAWGRYDRAFWTPHLIDPHRS